MPYATEGTLTTDKREVAISETWDTDGDWGAYQSKSNVEINNGALELAQGVAPASVLYQVRVEEFANPWPFNIGSTSMDPAAGLTQSTFSNGADGVYGDGTDDYGYASGPDTLPSNTTFGIAATWQATADGYLMGVSPSGSNNPRFRLNISGGNLSLSLGDTDSGFTVQASFPLDGNPHAIVINKTGDLDSDVEMYIDDMATDVASVSNTGNFNSGGYSSPGPLGFWCRNNDGDGTTTPVSITEATAGIFEFNGEPYTQTERENFVGRRPEV